MVMMMGITLDDAGDFDLNLLLALEALLSERNVTRAAERIGVGQPAMSHSLARLRAVFKDPLLVRGKGGMEPTARAQDLAGPLREVLERLRGELLEPRAFDPLALHRTFVISASDYSLVVLVSRVMERLATEAPSVRLVVRSVPLTRIPGLLDDGEIDLAVTHGVELSPWQKSAPLFSEVYACIYDSQACGFSGRLTLKRYQSLPHAFFAVRDELVDGVAASLREAGAKGRVVFSTIHVLSVPYLVSGKPLIATVPRRIAERAAALSDLTVSPLPVEFEPVQMVLVWHGRNESNRAQSWLRDLFREEARNV